MNTFHIFPTHAELAEMHPRITARIDRQYEWHRQRGILGLVLWNTPRVLIGVVIVFGVAMVFHTSETTTEAVNRICAFPPNYLLFYLVAYFTFLWRTELLGLRLCRRLHRLLAPQAPAAEPAPLPVRNRLKHSFRPYKSCHRRALTPSDWSRN